MEINTFYICNFGMFSHYPAGAMSFGSISEKIPSFRDIFA